MIQVTVMSNTTRDSDTIDPNSESIRSMLERFNVDYSSSTVHVDGVPVGLGQMDTSFADLGITTKCYISAVVKQDNR